MNCKKVVSFFIAIILAVIPMSAAYAKNLIDIKGHWAEKEIMEFHTKKHIMGYPDGTFKPDDTITRSEFSALLARFLKLEKKESEKGFKDVKRDLWSKQYVDSLIAHNILKVKEYDHGVFKPSEAITRLEIVKMLIRSVLDDEEVLRVDVDKIELFEDDMLIEEKYFVYLARHFDLINGFPDNTFRANAKSTRAEAVKLLCNYNNNASKIRAEYEHFLEEKNIKPKKEKSKKKKISNRPPTAPILTATPLTEYKGDKTKVAFKVTSEDPDGDPITFEYEGRTEDDYYAKGNHKIKVRGTDGELYTQWVDYSFKVDNRPPTAPILTATPLKEYKGDKTKVAVKVTSEDTDGDPITFEYEGRTEDDYYAKGNHKIKVRGTDGELYTQWVDYSFKVDNRPPTAPILTATPLKEYKGDKTKVAVKVTSEDPDGDPITFEYEGRTEDDYYAKGNHKIRVRGTDGELYTQWVEYSFTVKNTVTNQAPSRPIITISPDETSILPNTQVMVTAKLTDPEGDAISYIWEGRPSETSTYPSGNNTIRVKAVDSAGAESPWTAIVFFTTDPNYGSGMTMKCLYTQKALRMQRLQSILLPCLQ